MCRGPAARCWLRQFERRLLQLCHVVCALSFRKTLQVDGPYDEAFYQKLLDLSTEDDGTVAFALTKVGRTFPTPHRWVLLGLCTLPRAFLTTVSAPAPMFEQTGISHPPVDWAWGGFVRMAPVHPWAQPSCCGPGPGATSLCFPLEAFESAGAGHPSCGPHWSLDPSPVAGRGLRSPRTQATGQRGRIF